MTRVHGSPIQKLHSYFSSKVFWERGFRGLDCCIESFVEIVEESLE